MDNKFSFRNIFWILVILASVFVIASVIKLFLASFTIGVFLYYASRPLYNKVQNKIHNSTYSAVITLSATFVPSLIFTGYIIQLGYYELKSALQTYNIKLTDFLSGSVETEVSLLLTTPTKIIKSQQGLDMIRELMNWAVLVVGFVGDVFLKIIIVAVVMYYLLKHDERLYKWATTHFGMLTPRWKSFWSKVDEDLSQIYFGNILNSLITMIVAIGVAFVYSYLAPQSIEIPYPILFGVVVGISSLIPVVGVKIAYVPVSLYLFITAYTTDPATLFPYVIIFALFCIVILDFLQDLLLRPYISGRHMHIGLLLISYIAGPLLIGWYGFFLAPIILVLIHHFADIILPDLLAEWY